MENRKNMIRAELVLKQSLDEDQRLWLEDCGCEILKVQMWKGKQNVQVKMPMTGLQMLVNRSNFIEEFRFTKK